MSSKEDQGGERSGADEADFTNPGMETRSSSPDGHSSGAPLKAGKAADYESPKLGGGAEADQAPVKGIDLIKLFMDFTDRIERSLNAFRMEMKGDSGKAREENKADNEKTREENKADNEKTREENKADNEKAREENKADNEKAREENKADNEKTREEIDDKLEKGFAAIHERIDREQKYLLEKIEQASKNNMNTMKLWFIGTLFLIFLSSDKADRIIETIGDAGSSQAAQHETAAAPGQAEAGDRIIQPSAKGSPEGHGQSASAGENTLALETIPVGDGLPQCMIAFPRAVEYQPPPPDAGPIL